MLIERIKASGFLSFGPQGIDLPLRPLNVFIGPNGSGKSNLIELFALLQAVPRELREAITGSPEDWAWRGTPDAPEIAIETELPSSRRGMRLVHALSMSTFWNELTIADERIEYVPARVESGGAASFVYEFRRGHPVIREKTTAGDGGQVRELDRMEIGWRQSIITQFRDPNPLRYVEIRYLQRAFEGIRIYRNWYFGPDSPLRRPQIAAGPADVVNEDFSNYQRVLWNLRKTAPEMLQEYLPTLFEGAKDLHLDTLGDTVLLSVREEGFGYFPLSRLSDGTVRYLCLLAILLNPSPSPLIVIDEPDLGLHPDLMPTLVKLLVHASKKAQLIVTTHSRQLIDALSDQPESVVVCGKDDGGTFFERLSAEALAVWLERYSLGQLWSRGELGGNRW